MRNSAMSNIENGKKQRSRGVVSSMQHSDNRDYFGMDGKASERSLTTLENELLAQQKSAIAIAILRSMPYRQCVSPQQKAIEEQLLNKDVNNSNIEVSQSDKNYQMKNRFNNGGTNNNNCQPTEDSGDKDDWQACNNPISVKRAMVAEGKQQPGSELSEPPMQFVSTINPPFLSKDIYESTLDGRKDNTDGTQYLALQKQDNSMVSIMEHSGPRKLIVINQQKQVEKV